MYVSSINKDSEKPEKSLYTQDKAENQHRVPMTFGPSACTALKTTDGNHYERPKAFITKSTKTIFLPTQF